MQPFLDKLIRVFQDSPCLKYSALISVILILPYLPHPKPLPQLPPLPNGVERVYVTAGDGKGSLELLIAKPVGKVSDKTKAPLLFVHGGYGSAFCWKNWIPYFASKGRAVYAISLSGHGLSTRPWFYTLRPKTYFTKDILAILEYITSNSSPNSLPPVLVGHSAGGGLSQYTVDVHGASLRTRNQISGVICVSPFPPYGGLGVYANWFSIDPWLIFRTLLDPYKCLSTPHLSSRAFFGENYCHSLHFNTTNTNTQNTKTQEDSVPEGYIQQMTKEESIVWPSGMLLPFINTQRVLTNITFGTVQRIHLVAGEQDVLMSPTIMRRVQKVYGCGLSLIEGAGHHMMLDVPWEKGADIVENKLQEWNL